MAKKTETKTDKIEREYVIPLREKGRHVPIYKKTPKAIKTIKEFLVKHMKIRDRDLKKIKVDRYLNELIWSRGIKNPPHKIKVKAIKEGDIVRVELVELSEKLKFKKSKEEKVSQKASAVAEGKKKVLEKAKEEIEEKNEGAPLGVPQSAEHRGKVDEEEKEKIVEEKKASVIEAGAEMEKAAAKQMKHEVGGKKKEPKIHRVALKK